MTRALTFKGFLDRKAVTDKIGPAAAKVLGHFGGKVRKTAQGYIRTDRSKKQKPSPPGKPPKSRTGALRQNIFYSYERTAEEVVIGPIILNRPNPTAKGSLPAPAVLEYGGTQTIRRPGQPPRRAAYAARPYMNPALQKHLTPELQRWKDSIR